MVICVVVERNQTEDVRKKLSSRGIISDTYEIDIRDGLAYIPVTSDVDNFETIELESPKLRDYNKTLEDILGYSPTYEWIGDIIVLEESGDKIKEIVEAFNQSSHNPKTIVNKESSISGDRRVADYNILHGETTETVSKEYGYEYKLDITETYFTPRLAEERNRVVSQISSEDRTFDMFAGVGPFAIPAADVGSRAVATDINSKAICYLRENALRNEVDNSINSHVSDVQDLTDEYRKWADNVIMNLPHTADEYIESATTLCSDGGKLYYYCFMSEQETVESETKMLENKVDGSLDVDDWRSVRPYAPGVQNVCIEYQYFG